MFNIYEDKLLTPQQSTPIKKRPLVLNKKQWKEITGHLNRDQENQILSEQEQRYRDYLRTASKAMTSKWENSVEKILERKVADRARKEQEKTDENEKRYREIKEMDEAQRREKLEKAEQSIRKSKLGPRHLESAAVLCEVLKGRDMQRQIKVGCDKIVKERYRAEGKELHEQAIQWIEDQQRKSIENKRRIGAHKREVYDQAKQAEIQKMTMLRQQVEVDRQQREAADNELRAQIEREKASLQRKKETMRRNALEAMKIAEQRRLRAKIEDEIENKIIDIYSEGKATLLNIQKEKRQEIQAGKNQLRSEISKKLAEMTKATNEIEEQKLQKAIAEIEEKHQREERNRQEYEANLRKTRIQQQISDIEQRKREENEKLEEYRQGIINRIKNQEISKDSEKQTFEDKWKKISENRNNWSKQIDEKKSKEAEIRQADLNAARKIDESDNKYFFDYAKKLIKDAKLKQRPILPLVKAVHQYKKDNFIQTLELQPHLRSNVPITYQKRVAKTPPDPIIKYGLDELKQLNPKLQESNKNEKKSIA